MKNLLFAGWLAVCSSWAAAQPTLAVPVRQGWFDGQPVWYLPTDASRADAAIDNAANLVPRLANALPLSRHEPNPLSVLDRIYKFAAQPSVLPSIPQPLGAANRDRAYSPLWDVIMEHWQPGRTVRELRSVDDVLAAEDAGDVRLEPLELVVNCPVLQVGNQALPGITPLPLP
jgi:hypothetical protein